MTESTIGIDRDQMQTFLRVVEAVDQLPHHHPDAVAVREATAQIFKNVKLARRAERQAAVRAADAAVIAATATGAPGRHRRRDRRAARWPPRRPAPPPARWCGPCACYICKTRFHTVDAFYHQLCPPCAELNRSRRDARTDLTGRTRAAHRRPRQDRHVHRPAAAARRRAHDDHHPLPARRGAPVQPPCPTAPTGCTGCGSSASTCATRRRSSRSPTRSPPAARWTS